MADDPEYIDLLEQLVMKRLGQGRTAGQTPKQTPKPKARYDPGALAEEMFFGEASATGDPIADVAADVAGGGRTPLPGPPPQGGRENGGGRDAMPRVSAGGDLPGLLNQNSRFMRNQRKGFGALQWLLPQARSLRKGAEFAMDVPRYLNTALDYWAEDPDAQRGR